MDTQGDEQMKNTGIATSNHIQSFIDADVLEWIEFTTSTKLAQEWKTVGFTPEIAAEWRDEFTRKLGASPTEAAEMRDAGMTPQKACQYLTRSHPAPMRRR